MGYIPVQIANMALASFGCAPIQSLTDPSNGSVGLLYTPVMRGLLAEYPWSFTKQTVPLSAVDDPLLADGFTAEGWQWAYAMPADMLGLPVGYSSDGRKPDMPQKSVGIQGQTIFCNRNPLWCVGRFYVDEASWPDYFVMAAIKCFAAELIMPISGNSDQLARFQESAWGPPQTQRAGGALGAAKRADALNQPSKFFYENPLTAARLA